MVRLVYLITAAVLVNHVLLINIKTRFRRYIQEHSYVRLESKTSRNMGNICPSPPQENTVFYYQLPAPTAQRTPKAPRRLQAAAARRPPQLQQAEEPFLPSQGVSSHGSPTVVLRRPRSQRGDRARSRASQAGRWTQFFGDLEEMIAKVEKTSTLTYRRQSPSSSPNASPRTSPTSSPRTSAHIPVSANEASSADLSLAQYLPKHSPRSSPRRSPSRSPIRSPGKSPRSSPQTFSKRPRSTDYDVAGVVTDDVLYEDERVIAAKSLQSLIDHLVETLVSYPDEAEYIFAFLLGARIFLKPRYLLNDIYQACHLASLKNSDMMLLLSEWTELFPYDFKNARMMNLLLEITQELITDSPELREEGDLLMANLQQVLTDNEAYKEGMERLAKKIESVIDTFGPRLASQEERTIDICKISPNYKELAQQLTVIEMLMLGNIGPEEFVKSPFETTYNNRDLYTQWCNRLPFFVATEICMHLKKKQRVRVIQYFIDVAQECSRLGNLNSLMQILSGLEMSTVSRLKQTWAKVNKSSIAQYQSLLKLMDPSGNMANYRASLGEMIKNYANTTGIIKPIVIPWFSLFSKDAFMINEANADRLEEGGYINVDKFWKLSKLINDFIDWKEIACPFDRQDNILDYILTNRLFNENSLELASYDCEQPVIGYQQQKYEQLKAQARF